MAVLIAPVSFSQEVRPYSILLVFISLSTYLWITIIWRFNDKDRPSNTTIWGYVASAIISSYLHYFGLYLIMLQGLFSVLMFNRARKTLSYILLIYFLIFLAYLPWLPSLFDQMDVKAYKWIKTPQFFNFLKGYLKFLFNKSNMVSLTALVLYLYLFSRILQNIFKMRGISNLRTMLLSPDLLLVLWFIVPFAGMYIKSVISEPVLTNRNLIISLPAAYLLLSRAIILLPFRRNSQAVIVFVITCLLLSHTVFAAKYYTKPHKTQFREAVGYIVEHDHMYKNSIVIGNSMVMNYYFKRKGSDKQIVAGLSKSKIKKEIGEKNLQFIWYICGHHNCPEAGYIEYLNNNFTLIENKRFFDSEVWLFKAKDSL
jgi:hypothetical protein